jgi:multicomponent Na+:H+ antiporter subunit F
VNAVLAAAVGVAEVTIVVALALTVFRILRGPATLDRVVALDVVSYLVMGLVALTALRAGQAVLLDTTIVIGLVAFVATVALARFLLSSQRRTP